METNSDDMATEPPPQPPSAPPKQVAELIQTLDQASLLSKHLLTTTTTANHRAILAALRSANLSLSSFLSLHHDISATSSGAAADVPMAENAGDCGGEEEEQNSKDSTMEKMEEKMRDSLYIQNKRPKRLLSPCSLRRGLQDDRDSAQFSTEFDPRRTQLRNLDLVYQFHG